MTSSQRSNVQVTITVTCLNFAVTGSRILLHPLSSSRRGKPSRKIALNSKGEVNCRELAQRPCSAHVTTDCTSQCKSCGVIGTNQWVIQVVQTHFSDDFMNFWKTRDGNQKHDFGKFRKMQLMAKNAIAHSPDPYSSTGCFCMASLCKFMVNIISHLYQYLPNEMYSSY